jgi:hypothetical protein
MLTEEQGAKKLYWAMPWSEQILKVYFARLNQDWSIR